jgi:hypothetical protein
MPRLGMGIESLPLSMEEERRLYTVGSTVYVPIEFSVNADFRSTFTF